MRYIYFIVFIISIQNVLSDEIEFISGQFDIEIQKVDLSRQWDPNSFPSIRTFRRSYLIVKGDVYNLYRYSRKEINEFDEKYNPEIKKTQQVQVPTFYKYQDFYIYGYKDEDKQFCKFKGDIDHDKKIVYEAEFIKAFNDDEIVKALSSIPE